MGNYPPPPSSPTPRPSTDWSRKSLEEQQEDVDKWMMRPNSFGGGFAEMAKLADSGESSRNPDQRKFDLSKQERNIQNEHRKEDPKIDPRPSFSDWQLVRMGQEREQQSERKLDIAGKEVVIRRSYGKLRKEPKKKTTEEKEKEEQALKDEKRKKEAEKDQGKGKGISGLVRRISQRFH